MDKITKRIVSTIVVFTMLIIGILGYFIIFYPELPVMIILMRVLAILLGVCFIGISVITISMTINYLIKKDEKRKIGLPKSNSNTDSDITSDTKL